MFKFNLFHLFHLFHLFGSLPQSAPEHVLLQFRLLFQTRASVPNIPLLSKQSLSSKAFQNKVLSMNLLFCFSISSIAFASPLATPTTSTLSCSAGQYPSALFVPHNTGVTVQTCYPVPSETSTCTGGYGSSTRTLYSGSDSVVTDIQCTCDMSNYETFAFPATALSGISFCMPRSRCQGGATSSSSVNEFCKTFMGPLDKGQECTVTEQFCVCPTGQSPEFAEGTKFVGCSADAWLLDAQHASITAMCPSEPTVRVMSR